MKATDLTIAFILIIMPSVLMLDYKTKETNRAIYETTRISQILDAAVEDATAVMFEKDISGTVSINKDKGVNSLMQTMCLNFDLLDDDLSRRLIEGYIPCIVSIEYDGYCVMRHEEYLNEKNEPELRMTWLPKQPYSFSDTRYIYSFTLGDELTVYQKTSNAIINGTTDSLLTALPGSSILVAPDAYNTTEQRIEQFYLNKQIAMVEQLKRDIDEIINNHNRIAQHYGITYYFTLPDMEKDDWLSVIDDVGIVAFFQGMPIGVGGEAINQFAIGGSTLLKGTRFYLDALTMPSPDGIYYYHTSPDCPLLKTDITVENIMKDSAKDFAKEGYFPCEDCH